MQRGSWLTRTDSIDARDQWKYMYIGLGQPRVTWTINNAISANVLLINFSFLHTFHLRMIILKLLTLLLAISI